MGLLAIILYKKCTCSVSLAQGCHTKSVVWLVALGLCTMVALLPPLTKDHRFPTPGVTSATYGL